MSARVTPESAGWGFSGLEVVRLAAGAEFCWDGAHDEAIVVPLSGGCTVVAGGDKAELAGRPDVFAGPTDVAYVPLGRAATISSADGGRFAVATARAEEEHPFRHVRADDVPVELRGAGACSRQVHDFGTPAVLEAHRIIACEVITPGGNWSSDPPRKHDEVSDDESELEEIYYYEVADGGPAYQRVYGTADRPIDVLAEVRTGDVVVGPHGWHGPSMGAPGCGLY